MSRPALSVIIPSYMRSAVLWNTVEALRPQLVEADEVIVVDQNHPPLSLPASLQDPRIRLVPLDIASLTRARNAGIAAARNDHLVFLDDDIVPDATLLREFREGAQAHPGCILTGVVDQDDKPDDVPSPGSINLDTGEIRTNFSRALEGETPFFPGGLSLIPRSCLPPPPHFCPAFRGASQGEEIDFCLRARRRGVRIVSRPAIRIFHLKVVEGGCRAPAFKLRFFLDQAFNQALFFGRHGHLPHLGSFLGRIKGLVEFHTRKPGGGRDRALLAQAFARLASGLLQGILLRASL